MIFSILVQGRVIDEFSQDTTRFTFFIYSLNISACRHLEHAHFLSSIYNGCDADSSSFLKNANFSFKKFKNKQTTKTNNVTRHGHRYTLFYNFIHIN